MATEVCTTSIQKDGSIPPDKQGYSRTRLNRHGQKAIVDVNDASHFSKMKQHRRGRITHGSRKFPKDEPDDWYDVDKYGDTYLESEFHRDPKRHTLGEKMMTSSAPPRRRVS